MSKKQKFGVDAPSVTNDEATELMVHHLQLAAMYFEAVPPNDEQNLREIARLLKDDDRTLVAAKPFYLALQRFYDSMKDNPTKLTVVKE